MNRLTAEQKWDAYDDAVIARRERLHRALDAVLDMSKRAKTGDGYLDDPKNTAGALKNLAGSSREWGGPKVKAKLPIQDYPTWSQLKKGTKVRVKVSGQEARIAEQGVAWVILSDGTKYTPKQLELV